MGNKLYYALLALTVGAVATVAGMVGHMNYRMDELMRRTREISAIVSQKENVEDRLAGILLKDDRENIPEAYKTHLFLVYGDSLRKSYDVERAAKRTEELFCGDPEVGDVGGRYICMRVQDFMKELVEGQKLYK